MFAFVATLICVSIPPVVIAPVGESVPFVEGMRWKELLLDDDTVVDIRGNNQLYAIGKAPGIASAIFTLKDGQTRRFLFVVPKAK